MSTPAQRSLSAKLAAHVRLSRMTAADRRDMTAPATQAWLDRWEQQVDPDGLMSPQDRATAAAHARKAYMSALALKRHHSK